MSLSLKDERLNAWTMRATRYIEKSFQERTGDAVETISSEMRAYDQQQEVIDSQLRDIGFKTKTISLSIEDVFNGYTPLNAKVYTNRDSKRKIVVFPVHERHISVPIDQLSDDGIDPAYLLGSAREFYLACESAGVTPKPILDFTSKKAGGSTHCMQQTIANIRLESPTFAVLT